MGVNAIIYEDYVSFIYELKRREEDTSFWARLWRRFQVVPAKRPARRR
ncbi:MAG TPA: hypothetical protein VG406_07845 [Isosphaeraceae bacterium]|nr:hypothetical protein [Isosphaeraceae bacterium]